MREIWVQERGKEMELGKSRGKEIEEVEGEGEESGPEILHEYCKTA